MLERALVVVCFHDICEAGRQVPWIMEHRPIALEAIDHRLFERRAAAEHAPVGAPRAARERREQAAWLLVEFGADTKEEADEQRASSFVADAQEARGRRRRASASSSDEQQEQQLWQVREGGLGATAFPPDGHDHWPGWEDSAVPPERVGDYMADLKKLYDKYGYRGAMYGHIGQGCVHSRINFDLRTPQGLEEVPRASWRRRPTCVVSYGGSLSGEHGDGQQRAELLAKQYGEEIVEAFREFKRIWDPDWKMNPGKVVDPYRLDENLKLGADYEPWRPEVKFAYPEDKGDFAHATLRCVGVGKCRQPDGAGRDVPELHGHARGEAHDARPRAAALRDAAGRGRRGRLAVATR